jgi:cytochrome P450
MRPALEAQPLGQGHRSDDPLEPTSGRETFVRNDWSRQVFPHPAGRRPILGDVLGAGRAGLPQSTMQRGADLGPIFEMHVFAQKFVFVAGAELAAELCDETRFHKAHSPSVAALRDFAGDGLSTAYQDDPNWRLAHDLLRPAFTKEAMQRYHPIMLTAASELFETWDRQQGPVDVSAGMTKLTLETISRTAFSRDFGSFTRKDPHPFVLAMVAALRASQRKGVLNAMPGSGLLARRLDRRNAHHQSYVDSLIDDLIAQRRRDDDLEDRDLLGIMLSTAHPDSGQYLTDRNIRYQILTFLAAGHETTSGALSFALYYLSRNPRARSEAQAETDAILGTDSDAEPTYEQVAKFRHTRRAFDEALRLWPTAPAFARSPNADTVIGDRYPMRPQDWAIILIPFIHRDPSVWGGDAEEFRPDRFLPESSRGRAPHSYKPFGTGERACIGRQFALHEAVLVLARLLHRYDITGDPDYELAISERLTLMPKGFRITLARRTPATSPPTGAPPR